MEEDNKKYTYYLPDIEKKGEMKEFKTDKQSLIIVGANGSGKTKLIAHIMNKNSNKFLHIPSQKILRPDERENTLRAYFQTESSREKETAVSNDLLETINKLFDRKQLIDSKYADSNRERLRKGLTRLDPENTCLDDLVDIWEDAMGDKRIRVNIDKKSIVGIPKQENVDDFVPEYECISLSDGEKMAIYLIGKCILAPENSTIFIDEPELHLHKSIMNKLWNAIEGYRRDCFFVYVTHDLKFAASHDGEKIWVKEYRIETQPVSQPQQPPRHTQRPTSFPIWTWEEIKKDELPENLVFQILGSRRNVVFVEGTENSHDAKLYRELYPDYLVVPCGGCDEVKRMTKAFRARTSQGLHHFSVCGIIDRDRRTEEEIEKLKEKGIHVLEVAEIENLFFIKEVLDVVIEHTGGKAENVKTVIINVTKKFDSQIDSQIALAVKNKIRYAISQITTNGVVLSCLTTHFMNEIQQLNIQTMINNKTNEFKQYVSTSDYKSILRVFNDKDLGSCIVNALDLSGSLDFKERVLNLITRQHSCESMKNAFFECLPKPDTLFSI